MRLIDRIFLATYYASLQAVVFGGSILRGVVRDWYSYRWDHTKETSRIVRQINEAYERGLNERRG